MKRKSGSKNKDKTETQDAVYKPQDKIAQANLTPSEVIIICNAINHICKIHGETVFKTIDDIKTRMGEL